MSLMRRFIAKLLHVKSIRHAVALDIMAKTAIARQRGWVDGRNTNWVVC